MTRFSWLVLPTLLWAVPAGAALPNPPHEDVHFKAEHVPESALDARFFAFPWLGERLQPGEWQSTVAVGFSKSEISFFTIDGPLVALAAGRGVGERWGMEGLLFYDSMRVSGGPGEDVLRGQGLAGVPLDLPERAAFTNPRGDYRHWGLGGALVWEASPVGARRRWTVKAGLLFDRVEIDGFQVDYRLLGGADAGSRGVLDHSSQADFATPFLGVQWSIPLGASWVFAPRFVAAAQLPPGDFDLRLTGPGFDLGTARSGGRPGELGDGSLALTAVLIHRPSGLEIDVGGPLFFPLLEGWTRPGVDGGLVVQVSWHLP